MRIRGSIVAATAVAFVLLQACGTEAGPTPNKAAPPPGPDALRIELDAQMTDECFANPAEQNPPGCEKYVTQLASTPEVVENFPGQTNPELTAAAHELRAGVLAYRDNGCAGAGAEAEPACPQALVDIAAAVRGIDKALPPEATAPAGPETGTS